MKKKNGFTLIELLAVIVILAIIALIAVPVILNIIDKANKSAFKDTAYGIVSAGELYFSERMLDSNMISQNEMITLPDTTGKLNLKGEVPEGQVAVNTEGKVAMAINNGRYCAIKYYDDTEFELTEDIENCNLYINGIMTSTNNCINEGTCPSGTKVNVQVSPNQNYNFYVISDIDKLTLIMGRNLGVTSAWIVKADYNNDENYSDDGNNNKGPITAINYLDELTDEEWSNIIKKSYTYNGLGEDGETRKYEDITRTMRARMLTYEEINNITLSTNGMLPNYIYGKVGYWTSTARSSYSRHAWCVDSRGNFGYSTVSNDYTYGVRPVIELSK